MSEKILTLDARLGLDKYEIDEEQSHIQVDFERCKTCALRPCLTVCPAYVYQWVDDHIAVRYENCLECGTCQIACDTSGNQGITWRNPQGGFGIMFRYG
jgi:ferredoxin like protein